MTTREVAVHNGNGHAASMAGAAAATGAAASQRDFAERIEPWVGETVTVVTPESFEDAPVGRQMRAGHYRARLLGLGRDFLILATRYVHTGPRAGEEPVKQFVPFARVKRISQLSNERLLHL